MEESEEIAIDYVGITVEFPQLARGRGFVVYRNIIYK